MLPVTSIGCGTGVGDGAGLDADFFFGAETTLAARAIVTIEAAAQVNAGDHRVIDNVQSVSGEASFGAESA
jgi:hypothetical protein